MHPRRFIVVLVILLASAVSLGCNSSTSNSSSTTTAGAPAAVGAAAPRATAAAAAIPLPSAAAIMSPTPVAAFYPLTVKRSDGKTLVIKSQPKRIISLSAGTTEIFYAIGAQSQLVATDKYSDYPEEAKSTTKLDAFRPSPEAITGLTPDLIVIPDNQKQIVETLDGLGAPVLYLTVPGSIVDLLQQIQFYGDVTGHPAEAQKVAAGMRARIDTVQRKLADLQKGPRTYHEVDAKLYSAAPNSFVGDLYTLLQAQNIIPRGDKPYPQVSQEFIVSMDPEVIVLADAAFGETVDNVKARSGWAAISAVQNSRVFAIDDNLVSRPGPRIVDGLETLAKLLYPDRFQ